MCVQKAKKAFISFVIFSFLTGCGDMNTIIMPSTGTYQVRAMVNDVSLDECSLVNSKDTIRPFFARSVSGDPDVTGLVVFLKKSNGEILGKKVHYSLESKSQFGSEAAFTVQADSTRDEALDEQQPPPNSTQTDNEILIPVKQFDRDMPCFPMPENLPIGQYIMVFQVLGGKQNLHITEKAIYYLADAGFSFKDIQMYLPGITPGSRIIPKGSTIMLEARLDFDSHLDPYIVWYNGKKIISEGSFSGGTGKILWETPDQNGFLSLRAEAFPFNIRQGLAGSSREISLPVSSKAPDANLLSGDTPQLLHWYLFEGNLKDSKAPALPERTLISKYGKAPQWMPAGGSYGLATGPGDSFTLPTVSFSQISVGSGQFLIRFKPVADGVIFNTRFGYSSDAEMNLSYENKNLILSLSTSSMTNSETIGPFENDAFITAAIDFSIKPNRLEAKLNVKENPDNPGSIPVQTGNENIALAAQISGELKVTLGGTSGPQIVPAMQEPLFTALWNEFAILNKPNAN